MEIRIQAEGPEKKETIFFNNEELSNYNYIDVEIGGVEYTFNLNELWVTIRSFLKLKDMYEWEDDTLIDEINKNK